MNKTETNKVFTPSLPAQLTFIDRLSVNEQLVDAIYTTGKQLVVYGYSGSGKTTLIRNSLNQTYEGYLYSQCIKGTTIQDLLIDAFDQLNPYYISEHGNKKTSNIGGEIGLKFLNISSALKASSSIEKSNKSQRFLPPQLTPQNLSKFIGKVNACWVIDDFHKVNKEEKLQIAQIMKLFKDTAFEFPSTKIILIGAVQTAKEIVNYDKELEERLEQIYVPLMKKEELFKIIEKGTKLLNINFNRFVKNKIVELSGELGSVCHQLCLNICLQNGIYQTQEIESYFSVDELSMAIEKYIRSKSGSMKNLFDTITITTRKRTYDNIEIILKALINSNKESIGHYELLQIIRIKHNEYPASNLRTYLNKLSNPNNDNPILYKNIDTNEYSFSNPFFKVYCAMRFNQKFQNSDIDIQSNINKTILSGNISNTKDKKSKQS